VTEVAAQAEEAAAGPEERACERVLWDNGLVLLVAVAAVGLAIVLDGAAAAWHVSERGSWCCWLQRMPERRYLAEACETS